MDLSLSELEFQIRDMLRDMVRSDVAPHAEAWDHAEALPDGVIATLGELGVLGLAVPEEQGGAGLDTGALAVALEELARGDGALALVAATHALATHVVLEAGDEAQRVAWAEKLASGACLGTWARAEGDDADLTVTDTVATRTQDGWSLSGAKRTVVAAAQAGCFVVLARLDAAGADAPLAAFLVPADAAGVSVGDPVPRMGLRAAAVADVAFDGVALGAGAQLGGGALDTAVLRRAADAHAVALGALAVGLGRGALEEAARYALEREQFGQPIARFQAIQTMLADAAIEVDGARLLVARAAALLDRGRPASGQAASARLFAAEAAQRAADSAIQVHGGYGYTREYPVERIWRDARTVSLHDGTPSDARGVIAGQALATVTG